LIRSLWHGPETSPHAAVRRRPKGVDERTPQGACDDHIFAERAAELRERGEALIREADNLACQSWNERMWSDGGPIDPSPTIDQAINGGLAPRRTRGSKCLVTST
jgi:hypothetical protein